MFNLQNYYSNDRNYLKSFLLCCSLLCLLFFSANAANAATFTVTNVADSGAGSLRQAILNSNAAGGVNSEANVINFNFAGGIGQNFQLTTALPNITYHLTIDGTTMPGYNNAPLVHLYGGNISGVANGLTNRQGTLTVKALSFRFFGGNAIESKCAGVCNSNTPDVELNVTGCFIGTDRDGVSIGPNEGNGIYYQPHGSSSATRIGGPLPSERNIISSNHKNGILIRRPDAFLAKVSIVNNHIGVNINGTGGGGNTLSGIAVEDTISAGAGLNVYIGNKFDGFGNVQPPTLADRNVISSNGVNGIFSTAQQTFFQIQGNYIGTNGSGTGDAGNTGDGIKISGVNVGSGVKLKIGGAAAVEANVVSGNSGYGIDTSNIGSYIQGNKIGTNAAGTAALGNTLDGVRVSGASSYVGGSDAGEGNLISGNANGVKLEVGADLARVEGNKIGTNLAGTAAIPNTANGISVLSNSVGIGFANNAPSINIISGNDANGISISGTATGVDIFGNFIGTNASDQSLSNGGSGVVVLNCATTVRVGADFGNTPAGNTIAYNAGDGVAVSNICFGSPLPLTTTTIRRNSIYSNGGLGIDLGTNGVRLNDAGDTDTGPNNLQNYPVLLKVSPAQLYGTFNSLPNQTYTADIFQSATCDVSGSGEGKTLIGTTTLTTDAGGNTTYNLTGFPIIVGQIITTTATDSLGNTSEFSQCLTATNNPGNIAFNTGVSFGTDENSGNAAIVVNRVNGSSGIITADFTTSNGSAIAGQDYATTSGTVTFLNGEISKTIFVPIINDTLDELAESFNIALNNPTGGAFITNPSTHIELITDDDNPPTVSIGDISILEGNQGATVFTFNVSLSAASGLASSVNFSTANGTATAGIDYAATSGTVNFAAGETLKTASVTVNTDLISELNETFFVNLATPLNLTIADGQGIGTILDDDNAGKIAFAFATYSTSEGSPNATITLARTNGIAGAVAVNYTTSNGTATAGSDYTTAAGTLVFNDGQTSASFNVPILQDANGEANETVFLSISNPVGGATLGTPTNAVLTILDDDGGLPANVSIGGQIIENALPLANVLVTLNGSQTATALTNSSGNYSFPNLPAGGNFLITPTLNGHSFEPQSASFINLAANISNANFVGSTGIAARNLRVVPNSTISGQDVIVAVDLQSQGNENSVGFSLIYDAALVFNPQVSLGADAGAAALIVNNSTAGRVGVILALPAGQTFAAGNRQLVNITFNTAVTTLFSTPLAFSDSPVIRKVADANAGGLPVSYSDGLIGFSQGFEADVAGRPAGDGVLAVDDFTQVGRFVAGLDTTDVPVATNEFQRADNSPRGTKGDGTLAVDDFTQAGRYAAGLDTRQTAGGATQAGMRDEGGRMNKTEESLIHPSSLIPHPSISALPRIIRVVNASTSPGSQVLISIEIDANGDENGFGFTLNYDVNKLSNPLVAQGAATQGTFLIPNTNTLGRVGVILAFAPGSTIAAGTKQIVTIRFDVAVSAAGGLSPLVFGDAPVIRRVADANAAVLPTTFTDGNLDILAPTAANVSIGGRVLTHAGQGISRAVVAMTDASGAQRLAVTNPFGYYRFAEVPAGEIYIFSVSSKRHSFAAPSRVLSITEDVDDINFVSEEQ